jgi:hypothetical protein
MAFHKRLLKCSLVDVCLWTGKDALGWDYRALKLDRDYYSKGQLEVEVLRWAETSTLEAFWLGLVLITWVGTSTPLEIRTMIKTSTLKESWD